MSQPMFGPTAWRAWAPRLADPRRLARAMMVLAAAALVAGAAAAAGAAPDANGTALDRYLDGLKSLRTAFTQTVTDARGSQVEAGGGTLLGLWPGKIPWGYQPRGG